MNEIKRYNEITHLHKHGEECCQGKGHDKHKHGEECCHGKGHHKHKHGEECCHGHGHHHGERPLKVGILLALFGTTVEKASVGYDEFEARVRERFGNIPVHRAYTADKIRRKIKRLGGEAYNVAQALTEMYDAGFTHVAVQSLHTVPGVEYEWTVQQAKACEHPRKGLQKITIGLPLITERFIQEAIAAMPSYIPSTIAPDEGVILIGHGTYHDAQIYYHALQGFVQSISPNFFMGTLMGDGLGVGDAMARLRARNIKKVHLLPFMGVPGHHFVLDITGEQPRSWASILTKHGYECEFHSIGSLSHAQFADIWLDNLHVALVHLCEGTEQKLPALPKSSEYKVEPKGCNHSHGE